MDIKEIKDKNTIRDFFLKDPYAHLCELASLQESLFENTVWTAAYNSGEIMAIAMLDISSIQKQPAFYLFENKNQKEAGILLKKMMKNLPDNFYAHISTGLSPELADVYNVTDGFQCDKMIITGDMLLNRDIKYPEYTYRINRNDFETLDEIIRSVNPQALFTKAMLETGKYFCVRKNAELLSVAGVHCYSKEAGVAVVGNVLAMPEHRGNGYASSVTASLCRDMWPEVRYMGLNVDSDNIAAVKMFTNMGFVFHSNYEEIEIKKK